VNKWETGPAWQKDYPMMDAANWLQSTYPQAERGSNEPRLLGRPTALAGVQRLVSVAVLCADPVIAAGLTAILGSHRAFQVISAGETDVPNDNQPLADVILADYETAMHLARCAPQWMQRLLVYSNCDSEARICLALESGARGYMLHGASVVELINAVRSIQDGGVVLSPAVAARVTSREKGQVLTRRERAVLEQLMQGVSNKVIANRLNMCLGTVKSHVKSILQKLKAESRTAAVIAAQRRGLLT
jgi:DNA-binding NarL/FixJ family response regulator